MTRLNLGCGDQKLKGYTNIDIDPDLNPDIALDIRTTLLPFKDGTIACVTIFHTIEHIERRYHDFVFQEIHRVLDPGGILLVSYPEFETCAKNYVQNVQGKRNFWRDTLYGRQLTMSDYHVTPMDTKEFKRFLKGIGFTDIYSYSELHQTFNTIVSAFKTKKPKDYEAHLNEYIFDKTA